MPIVVAIYFEMINIQQDVMSLLSKERMVSVRFCKPRRLLPVRVIHMLRSLRVLRSSTVYP